MLATTTPYRATTTATFHDFLPAIPSPLSPRSANIYGPTSRAPAFFMSSSEAESENSKKNNVPFSQRAVKKAPSPKPDELKERRRSMFLKKVKDGREERRFEARGEDILRLDFMQRQKQWEAQLAREASFISPDIPEDEEEDKEERQGDFDLPGSSNAMQISLPSTQQPILDYEVDEVEQREREELEALLSYMPVDEENVQDSDQSSLDHLYSDDDDYDALFSEMIAMDAGGQLPSQQMQHQQQLNQHGDDDGEEMDMS